MKIKKQRYSAAFNWAILLLVGTFLFSCKHSSSKISRIDEAQQLLNEREYDKAIQILEVESKNDSTGQATLLLASAYAGSARINLIDSYDFFFGFLFDKPGSTHREVRRPPANSQTDRLLFLSQLLQAFLMNMATDSKLFLTIPKLDTGNRSRLVEAILVIDQVKKGQDYYIRSRQYLLFLNLMQFGNYFKDLFPKVDFAQDLTAVDLICGLEPSIFLQSFEKALQSFAAALSALDEVREEKNLKTQVRIEELKDITQSIQSQFQSRKLSYADSTFILKTVQQGYCP